MTVNQCLRTSLAILCLIGVIPQTQAQQKDPEGYYLTLTHDTIRGSFPHYRETANNPAAINFQKTGSAQPTPLTPDNCLLIVIQNSDTWLSWHGTRLLNPTSPTQDDMPDSVDTTPIFLRQVFNDGNYKLYEYAGQLRVNFYASGDTLHLQELYYKAFVQEGKAIESYRFRQQLSRLFQTRLAANANLTRRINEVLYTEPELAKLFQSASGGHTGGVAAKAPARFFIGLGASINFFHVTPVDPSVPIVSGTYNTSVSPVLQAGLYYPLGRGSQNFYFTAFLQGYYWKNSKTHPQLGTNTYKATVFNLPVGFGYKLIRAPNLSLAITCGAAATLIAKETQDGNYGYYTPGSSVLNPIAFHIDDNGNFHFTAFSGMELFIEKHVSLVFNYMLPYSVGDYLYYSPKHSAAQCSVRYSL